MEEHLSDPFIAPEQCPAVGNSCNACLNVARTAMRLPLEDNGMNPEKAAVLSESSALAALVSEPVVGVLGCRQRQDRAWRIGESRALREIERISGS